MIITKIVGGLGNQMFQYAMARRLANYNHDLLKLDLSWYSEYKLRNYSLNSFSIIENIASTDEIGEIKKKKYIQEPFFHFDPEMLSLGSDVYLEGYWQSEKYFKDIEDIIREDFTLKNPPKQSNSCLIPFIKGTNSVSLHIRRGDYVLNPVTHHIHGVCPLGYYYQAIAKLVDIVAKPHFFIFTNDLPWALENIRIDFPFTYISTNNEDQGQEDLRLMSLCKYHIIANSTFSWWGAWLSQYSEKVVFAPQKWFNHSGHNTDDLIPKNWHTEKDYIT